MREIKFRAYQPEAKGDLKWWSWKELRESDLNTIFKHPEKYHLMQYTGLKDKNGVEIYEGDIVKCTESFPDELEFISKIFWGGSGFLVKKGTIYYPIDIYDSNPGRVSLNKMEIIGNIYDNPEMLEVS